MSREICRLEAVEKRVKTGEYTQEILKKVSCNIEEGQFVVILGSSGAGKSTLLNLISGLDEATSGSIVCDGCDLTKSNKKKIIEYRKRMGFVFQEYALIENLTVFENVSMMQVITGLKTNTEEILKKVGMDQHKNKFPSQLSGGEKQRVAIARALAKQPKILFCDEPTGALDEANGKNVLKILQELNKSGTTVIVVTHLLGMTDMANHIIKIVDGRIKEDIKNENVISAEQVKWA